MKSVSGKDFVKRLEKKGWKLQRINGSHHIYCKEDNPLRVILSRSSLLHLELDTKSA